MPKSYINWGVQITVIKDDPVTMQTSMKGGQVKMHMANFSFCHNLPTVHQIFNIV
jgi:ribonuclease PH